MPFALRNVFVSLGTAIDGFLARPWLRSVAFEPLQSFRAWALFGFSLFCIAVVMVVIGWVLAPQVHVHADQSDQGAYAYMARAMKERALPDYSDGVRNPLFPWLAARLVPSGFATHEEIDGYLVTGKRFSTILSALCIVVIGMFLGRIMPPLAAWNVAAVGGLGGLLPISLFFGAEPLFYALFFGMCLLAVTLLIRNPVWLYGMFGLLSGLACLAKPSTTPFLALFVVMSFLRWMGCWLRWLPESFRGPEWRGWRFVAGMLVFSFVYGLLLLPLARHSAQLYGDPFYNAPKKWFWLVDWGTAYPKYQLVRAQDLERMPPEEHPTPGNFFRNHSPEFAWWKLSYGTMTRLEQLVIPEQTLRKKVEKSGQPKKLILLFRGMYVAGAVALLLVLLISAYALGCRPPPGPWMVSMLFFLGMFAAYTLAYGWYLWIGPGPRYIMTFYLPILALALWASDVLRRRLARPWVDAVFLLALLLPPVFFLPRLIAILADPRFERVLYAF